MTAARRMREQQYARAIEQLWSELLERPVILSPRDWDRIRGWYGREVPLEVVREAIDELSQPRPRGRQRRPPRDLGAIERAVDESWGAVQQGRVVDQPPPEAQAEPAQPGGADLWRARAARERGETGLKTLLVEAAERLEAGEPVADVDRDIDGRIGSVAPRELIAQVQAEVERELTPVAGRMNPATLERTRERAVCERVRRQLGLPPSCA